MLKMTYKELVLRTYMPPQQFTGIVYLSDDMNPYEVISKWNNQGVSQFDIAGMLWHYSVVSVVPAVGMGSEAGQVKVIMSIEEA